MILYGLCALCLILFAIVFVLYRIYLKENKKLRLELEQSKSQIWQNEIEIATLNEKIANMQSFED